MNKALLIGRLTADPQSGKTPNGKVYAKFSIAINGYGDHVDYINIVVWEKTAEAAIKYLTKGKQVAIEGSIQTGSYESNGVKRQTFDVRADRIEFVGNKNDSAQKPNSGADGDTLQEIDEDDDMPF